MTATPTFHAIQQSDRAIVLHDLRHALFAIQLTPLLLEKYREDESRFHQVCECLSHECEVIAALIEREFTEE